MGNGLLIDEAANGGFPEPPLGEPVRVVAACHNGDSGCGETTRVRLPGTVPARIVRRVRCSACAQPFAAEPVEELPPTTPAPRRRNGFNPDGRLWRWASIPLAAGLVIGGLLLIQGDDDSPSALPPATPSVDSPAVSSGDPAPPATPPSSGDDPGPRAAKPGDAEIVKASSYTLALPAGWERIDPPDGAAFAAVSAAGGADATLWIKEDPKLDFPEFIRQSLRQLETLAPNPEVGEQVSAPTPEASSAVLIADAPPGQPRYEVLLRVSGPYRYHLATTTFPDATREEIEAVELLTKNFTPEGGV